MPDTTLDSATLEPDPRRRRHKLIAHATYELLVTIRRFDLAKVSSVTASGSTTFCLRDWLPGGRNLNDGHLILAGANSVSSSRAR